MFNAYLAQGDREFAEGKYLAAINSYNKAIDRYPQSIDAHEKLGLTAQKLGKAKLADNCFATVEKLKTEDPDISLNLVESEQQDILDFSEKDLPQKTTGSKQSPSSNLFLFLKICFALFCLTRLIGNLGMLAGAIFSSLVTSDITSANKITATIETMKAEPSSGDEYRSLGLSYLTLEKYPEAIANLTRAIELNPQDTKALEYRSYIYFHQQEYDKTIADLTSIIAIDPEDRAARKNRGYIYYLQENYELAEAEYSKLIKQNPQLSASHCTRAAFYNAIGNDFSAKFDLLQAKSIMPYHSFIRSSCGNGLGYQINFDN